MNTNDTARAKLNSETAQFPWTELLRHFAAGDVIMVADQHDLVEVGLQISMDNKSLVQQWLDEGTISKVSDLQAQAWLESDAHLWTVVVKPWILVQQRESD